MYGAATSWAPNALIFFEDDKLVGLMAQMFEAGRLIFAIPSGMLADVTGRKTILILVGIINIVSWIVLSMTTSLTLIFIARSVLHYRVPTTEVTGAITSFTLHYTTLPSDMFSLCGYTVSALCMIQSPM